MNAHVLLNLLNKFGNKIRCEALLSILQVFQRVQYYRSMIARFYLSCMYDTEIAIFAPICPDFSISKCDIVMNVVAYSYMVNLHI